MHGTIDTPNPSAECVRLIRERCGVVIHELRAELAGEFVHITGLIGSWHGKQLASEAARSLFPTHQIDNQLQVTRQR